MQARIRQAQKILRDTKYLVALTGAGVSTPSGIPDFRSPGSGLWEKMDPFAVASLSAFRRHPEAFYDWIRPMIRQVTAATPNPAHRALAELERMGILQATITQNIDGLNLLAGSNRVIEIHGNFRNATCIGCYEVSSGQELLKCLMESEDVPTCPSCGGTLKPNVILFGEQLPFSELQASHDEIRKCDVMLVAGSSLTIDPAASLPKLARRHGAQLIFVNLEPTWLDEVASVVIHADVAQVLPEIVNGLSESNDKSR